MQRSQWSFRAGSRLARAVLGALVGLVVALGSCTGSSDPGMISPDVPTILILVDVHGVLADVASLQVRAALNGKSDPVGLNITNNTSQFALTLPNTPASLGTLRIDGFGLDTHQCYQASGSITTQLTAGTTYQELTLTLNSVGSRLCQLVVDVVGSGAVTSTPLGISCGGGNTVCSFGFPYGTAVSLNGPISPQSYPVWSANCPSGGAQSVSCKIATLGQGEQHVTATFVPRSCSPSGFCPYNPLPSSFAVSALWGSSAKDVWAVGAIPSAIMHYDGSVWTAAASPNQNNLTRVWGSGPTDAWALGGSSLLHYDGSKWAAVSGSGLTMFFAGATTGAANVWVAGEAGQVMHYDGTSWTRAFTAPEVWSWMWAGSPSDLWGLGTSGSVFHYNGQAATKDTSPALAGKTLTSLWGAGPANLWAASATEVFHWDGTTWTAQPGDSGLTLSGINGGGGSGGTEAYFAATSGRVFHHNGTADCATSHTCWSLAATPSSFTGTLRAVWGSSPSDLWAAGDFAGLIHFDGTLWKLDSSVGGSSQNLLGVWTTAVNVNASPIVSALATNQAIAFDSAAGVSTSTTLPSGLNAIYGATVGGATEVWAVGSPSTILRSTDGKNFAASSTIPPLTGTHTALNGVWMTATSATSRSYYVVGDSGYIARWDSGSTTWSPITGCSATATLKAIHGSASNLYAVGNNGVLFSISQISNTCTAPLTTPPSTNFNSVFFDGTTVWLAGDGGAVATYLPGAKVLTTITSGTTASLAGVWAGGGKNPAWVVGDSGTILSCDTTSCAPQSAGVNAKFRGVWGANPTDIWAVGNSGTMLRLKM